MSPRAAWRLESLGFPEVYVYAAGKAEWGAMGLPLEGTAASHPTIGTLARRDVPACRLNDRVGKIRQSLASWDTCFVVNDARVVLGRVLASELPSDDDASAESAMRPGPSTFRPNVSAAEMLNYLRDHELRSAPVTLADGTLVGLVRLDDLARAIG